MGIKEEINENKLDVGVAATFFIILCLGERESNAPPHAELAGQMRLQVPNGQRGSVALQ